jgi:hypothetical protein
MFCLLFLVVGAVVCDEITLLMLVTDSVGCKVLFVTDWVVDGLLVVAIDSLMEQEELFNCPSLITHSIQSR